MVLAGLGLVTAGAERALASPGSLLYGVTLAVLGASVAVLAAALAAALALL